MNIFENPFGGGGSSPFNLFGGGGSGLPSSSSLGASAGGFVSSFIKPLLPIFLITSGGTLLFIYVSSHAVERISNSNSVSNLASKISVVPVPI